MQAELGRLESTSAALIPIRKSEAWWDLSQDERRALLTSLETSLDAASAAKPNPGRTDTLRRLNRTEYQNAVRDLLALDIDATSLLPPDDSGHGFDNVTVGDLPRAVGAGLI